MQGTFTSFPLSYFKHLVSNLFRSPEILRPMSGDQQAPGRRGHRLRAPPSDGRQPQACLEQRLSPGSAAARRRTGGERWAPWSCLVPPPHSYTCGAPAPLLAYPTSPLQQASLLSPCFPKHCVGWVAFFLSCIWKLRGWGNLKNTSWSSDTQTAECLKQQFFLANVDNSHISH